MFQLSGYHCEVSSGWLRVGVLGCSVDLVSGPKWAVMELSIGFVGKTKWTYQVT